MISPEFSQKIHVDLSPYQIKSVINGRTKMNRMVMSWGRQTLCRLFLLSTIFAIGCAATEKASAMDLVGYNHTDQYIAMYVVNGYPGDDILPHGGGGSFICCISVPREWKPGMTVIVKWTDDRNTNPIPWKTRVVEVPPYWPDDIGMFAVHFFPGDEVKVLVTMKGPGHPEYPYPSPSDGRKQP